MQNRVKVLLVDDYKENLVALSQLIAAPDVETHFAMNAEEALQLLIEHDFALALLDVQMPVVSGFELARLIRGVKKYGHLPIIFVTAQQETSELTFEGYETGAVDVLFKPLNPRIVRSKVRVFIDLATQKAIVDRQVAELERLKELADRANAAKSQFLANMSHEIRTPLAAVMGFSEMIATGRFTEAKKDEYAKAIRRNGNLLLRLIDDILDMSRIEANKLEFNNEGFDLTEVIRDVDSMLARRASDKNIGFEVKRPERFPMFFGDSSRIKQVLINIIGNAIKFTSEGKVLVSYSVDQRESGLNVLRVTIEDNGIGIEKSKLDRLFKPFAQADSTTHRQFGGSGLGLIISRQIARALGGDVKVLRTEVGKGSTFEITFVLKSAETDEADETNEKTTEPKPAVRSHDLSAKKIMAVDDSPDNLTLLNLYLNDSGAELVCFNSAKLAIEEAQKNDFDLILMDIQMPEIDGYQATKSIRKNGFSGPILALTAHALESEREKCRASGCNAVISKPVSRANLLKAVNQYLQHP